MEWELTKDSRNHRWEIEDDKFINVSGTLGRGEKYSLFFLLRHPVC